MQLKREFEMLVMEDETIQTYATRMMTIVIQIRLIGEKFLDYRVVERIMISIFNKFE